MKRTQSIDGAVEAQHRVHGVKRASARLLVVDPTATTRLITHHALRALGCRHIDEVSDGIAALNALAVGRYDLLISTWRPPQLEARDLLWLIRQSPDRGYLPVIIADVVTPALVQEAADSGVSAFLPRPFGLTTLGVTLDVFLGRDPSRAPFVS